MNNSSRRYYSLRKGFNTKALQRVRLKMLQQIFAGIGLIKYPAFQGIGIKTIAIGFLKSLLVISLKDDLGGFQSLKQLIDIIRQTLCGKKLSCGNIQESNALGIVSKMYCSQEIVAAVLK